MAKRPKLPEVTTPIGTFKWPKLHEPDYGTELYPDEDGSFSVKLVLEKDAPETQAFLKAVEPHYQAAIAEGTEKFNALPIAKRKELGQPRVKQFFSIVYDEDTEEETGEIEFKASMKYAIKVKKGPKAGRVFHRWPHVVDAHGNQMDPLPEIGGGTRGRIRVQLSPYFVSAEGTVGLSFRLVGVQIIELVQYGKRSAESMGFEPVEGGYTYTPPAEPEDDNPFDNVMGNLGEMAEGMAETFSNAFADKTPEDLARDSALHDEVFGKVGDDS